MKKLLSFIIGAAVLCASVFAEPDSGEFWPSDGFDPANFYLETSGNFVAALYEFGDDFLSDVGGGITGGFGFNHGGWLFGLEYTHNLFGKYDWSNVHTNEILINCRRVLSQNSISFLPEWLEIVPGLAAGANIFTFDNGSKNTGVGFQLRPEIELTLIPDSDRFAPYIGADYNFVFSNKVDNVVAGYPRFNLGFRMYPAESKRAAAAAVPAAISSDISPRTGFTPDGDGQNDVATINTSISNLKKKPESWKVEILDQQGEVIKSWSGEGKVPEIKWDGETDSGDRLFSSETYTVVSTVVPSEKDRARLGQDVVTQTSSIKTGVLMEEIIPQKQWKIVVNTIYFDSNAATFNNLTDVQSQANKDTLDSIAKQTLALSEDIQIEIQGYANNVSNTEEEHLTELIPLSQDRANSIKNELINRGLKAANLTAVGKGGENPLAKWEDKAHWWKNRRVEFVVTK